MTTTLKLFPKPELISAIVMNQAVGWLKAKLDFVLFCFGEDELRELSILQNFYLYKVFRAAKNLHFHHFHVERVNF